MSKSRQDEQLLVTLVGVIRDCGRFAFDLERQESRKTQVLFEQWSQHLLLGLPPPGRDRLPEGERNFSELRAQFTEQRKREQSEFTQSQDALRDVVWTFISSLNREVAQDRAEDTQLSKTLSNVTTTLQSANPSEVRRIAMEAVKQVQGALVARSERQEKQLASLSQRLESMGTQLEVARRESTLDGLTRLFNRKAFDEQLERTTQFATLRGAQVALLVFDVDHFKKVNDTYGHPAGDAVLKAVALTSSRLFKGKSDFVARFGGEEFVVLVNDITHDEALGFAEKLRVAIGAMQVPWEDKVLIITTSIGVASRERGESGAQWLARADAALYRAKQGGRNRVEG
jgi:diguanylate cyclase (GGDEF)-like protein